MKLQAGLIFLGLFVLLGLGCQTPPTVIHESEPTQVKKGDGRESSEINWVVIDARPSFEYSLSHVPGAISMRWEDFSQKEEPYLGLLEKDLYFHARRLARMGIGPKTPVMILGRGPKGEGEEGRLAWTLKVLGVENVRFNHVDNFSTPFRNQEPPPLAAVPLWKPEVDSSLFIDKKEFLKLVMSPRSQLQSPIIIDVRIESDYLGKGQSRISKKAPDIGAMNIPWTNFIDSKGQANSEIVAKLTQVGIAKDRDIVLIDEKGVRSATAAMVLRELGFNKATNFAGGYMELIGN